MEIKKVYVECKFLCFVFVWFLIFICEKLETCCLFFTELHTSDQIRTPKSCYHHVNNYNFTNAVKEPTLVLCLT